MYIITGDETELLKLIVDLDKRSNKYIWRARKGIQKLVTSLFSWLQENKVYYYWIMNQMKQLKSIVILHPQQDFPIEIMILCQLKN